MPRNKALHSDKFSAALRRRIPSALIPKDTVQSIIKKI